MSKSSLILIRETPEQLTGSGCCGKLEGDTVWQGGNCVFEDSRKGQEIMGDLYMKIKEEIGVDHLDITYVDPRNQLYLIPKLLGDVLKFRPPLRDALKTMFMVFPVPAVILNGRIISDPTLGSSYNLEDITSTFNRVREVLKQPI